MLFRCITVANKRMQKTFKFLKIIFSMFECTQRFVLILKDVIDISGICILMVSVVDGEIFQLPLQ